MDAASPTPAPSPSLLYGYAQMCANSDYPPEEIRRGLLEKGATEAEALEILTALSVQIQRRQAQAPAIRRDLAWSTMKKGALWFIGGAVVTGISYANASDHGGAYWVTSGAILYGTYLMIAAMLSR